MGTPGRGLAEATRTGGAVPDRLRYATGGKPYSPSGGDVIMPASSTRRWLVEAPVLATERLTLRGFSPGDIDAFSRLLADREAMWDLWTIPDIPRDPRD